MPAAPRLLISKPGLSNAGNPLNRYDYARIAFSLGNKQAGDSMIARLKEDGYYESCILDMEGNPLELTV